MQILGLNLDTYYRSNIGTSTSDTDLPSSNEAILKNAHEQVGLTNTDWVGEDSSYAVTLSISVPEPGPLILTGTTLLVGGVFAYARTIRQKRRNTKILHQST